ncbi:hypothetical protein LUX31_24600 [Streptomyces sp. GQFP]|nr:hypothetical protein [Streptomyces sp. GQFP]UIX32941.1 hypothetical protein LUX31_24600 [Streptomyces sp. GQFP]
MEVSEVPEAPKTLEVVEGVEEPAVPEAAETPQEPPAPPRVRRRGRTTLLIAGAAVLGLVAGTCAGYLVQADREPTKLPSLSQPVLAQAKGEGPEPLSAAQDRRVKTDGDLRKLLLKRPKGAKDSEFPSGEDGWLDIADYADQVEDSKSFFGDLVADEFRRAANTTWQVGSAHSVEIRLVQYRQEEYLAAAESADGWNVEGTRSWPVPGTGEGMAYVTTKPEIEAGYEPMYSAEAHAWRGDIAMEVWVYDTKPISKAEIMDLAKRQMERL